MTNVIVHIDMDGVLCDYYGAHAEALEINPKIAYPQSQHGFYSKLAPIQGAITSYLWMEQHPLIDPYILTAPSILNPLSYIEKRIWVEENLGMSACEKLIICNQKNLLKGTILIDDQTSGRGQDKFEGELLQFGSSLYPDWPAIMHKIDSILVKTSLY